MKIPAPNRGRLAFTLTEMMIAGSLTTILIGGVLMGHLVGMRMFQYTKTKLGGNDDARRAISKLIDEVRSAKTVRIGFGDSLRFTECEPATPQQGSAIEIYRTSDTNEAIRYYLASDKLRRLVSGSPKVDVVASYITNQIVFTSESYNGVVLTNNANNRVIGLTLQFYQIEYPMVRVGTNEHFDYYQLRTKITRRALE